MPVAAVALALATLAGLLHAGAQDARLESSAAVAPRVTAAVVPAMPVEAVGGGEVMVELEVDADGAVAGLDVVRGTPPFTDAVTAALRTWRFRPGTTNVGGLTRVVSGRVLVLASFRPPALYLGATRGAEAWTARSPALSLPRPVALVTPVYPPKALGSRIVLVEVELTGQAAIRGLTVVTPPSGFDAAAREAVEQWRFLPPVERVWTRVFVYALLGFREPVVGFER